MEKGAKDTGSPSLNYKPLGLYQQERRSVSAVLNGAPEPPIAG